METPDYLYGFINIVLGIIFTSVGFKYKNPPNNEKEAKLYKKYGLFFKILGVGFIISGLIKLIG